jgi:hypothetical protein
MYNNVVTNIIVILYSGIYKYSTPYANAKTNTGAKIIAKVKNITAIIAFF